MFQHGAAPCGLCQTPTEKRCTRCWGLALCEACKDKHRGCKEFNFTKYVTKIGMSKTVWESLPELWNDANDLADHGFTAEAVAICRSTCHIATDMGGSGVNLGLCLVQLFIHELKRGKLDRASSKAGLMAIFSHPYYSDCETMLRNMANALEFHRYFLDAIKLWQMIGKYADSPQSKIHALVYTGRIHVTRKELKEAAAVLDMAISIGEQAETEDLIELLITLARMYYTRRNYPKAAWCHLIAAEWLAVQDPDGGLDMEKDNLAACCEMLGRADLAKRLLP